MIDPSGGIPLKPRLIALLSLLLAALALRVWDWPARYDVRDSDEIGYLDSSLAVVEGLPPGYKPSPAGPQVWLGWAWAECHVVYDLVHPDPALPKVPLQLRPFTAMTEALFDLYHDLSGMRQLIVTVNVILLLGAIFAGFGYGVGRGGIAGGVLVGGLLAIAPLFVSFSQMSRPYSMSWSFGVMAAYAVACCKGPRRIPIAAILLGLAIGSRIEMILLIPLLLWEIWDQPQPGKSAIKSCLSLVCVSLLTAYIVAPWLLTGLPGNLRAIATIQLANPLAATVTFRSGLKDLAWTNGFGPALLIFLASTPLLITGTNRVRRAVLVLIVLFIASTLLKPTGFGLHQKGSVLVVLILALGTSAGALHGRWPRATIAAIALALALPLCQTIRLVAPARNRPVIVLTDWIEANVPPGTPIYGAFGFKAPLPTQAAADAAWDDVTNSQAWRRKFASGLKRFGLGDSDFPRAMSEENLVQERGNFRRWFMLGAAGGGDHPRYDVKVMHLSPVFGVQNIPAEFAKTGGVVFWQEWYNPTPPELGAPVLVLPNADGDDVSVFCSPDLHDRLAAAR